MSISLPDMLIPKYRITQLPILPLLSLMQRSDKFKHIKSRYMIPSTKSSINNQVYELNQGWKKINGS